MFVIRWHHRLERAGVVPSPAVAHVDDSVLAPAQLAAQFGLACHRATHLRYMAVEARRRVTDKRLRTYFLCDQQPRVINTGRSGSEKMHLNVFKAVEACAC